jgi:hypothetical protein
MSGTQVGNQELDWFVEIVLQLGAIRGFHRTSFHYTWSAKASTTYTWRAKATTTTYTQKLIDE